MRYIFRKIRFPIIMLMALILICGGLMGCTQKEKLVILSGSENEALEPILKDFEKTNDIEIEMQYKGSVDMMMDLQKQSTEVDAVWPANGLWITLGDKNHAVKHVKSMMVSPVVFAVRKSLAQNLGLVKERVSVKELLASISEKKMTFMMTSATQSNSGASAYLGFLYALLDNPEMISKEDLNKPDLKEKIKMLLSGVNRSSGSSGWLKDLFLKGNYDAMVNYESMIIETNQELVRMGKEPLYIIYPYDGLVLADSPLGYIHHGDSKKEELFLKFQKHLLSKDIQQKIAKTGRRTGIAGFDMQYDANIYSTQWGIDTKKILSPIRLPAADVIEEALNLYQTQFKKPSYTLFCLDYSGSMQGDGENKLKEAMRILLDQDTAKNYLLQSSSEDVVVVFPFSGKVLDTWMVEGNDKGKLSDLLSKITNLVPNGSTDIYSPIISALGNISNQINDKYIYSVVLMTDGESNTGANYSQLKNVFNKLGKDIPIFSIMFGEAPKEQLDPIAELSRARVFDGKKDLIDAFKKVRGYN